MEYSLKRGFKPDLERIKGVLETEFLTEVRQEGEKLTLSYGALKSIEIWIAGKKLAVVTESAPGAAMIWRWIQTSAFGIFLKMLQATLLNKDYRWPRRKSKGKTDSQ